MTGQCPVVLSCAFGGSQKYEKPTQWLGFALQVPECDPTGQNKASWTWRGPKSELYRPFDRTSPEFVLSNCPVKHSMSCSSKTVSVTYICFFAKMKAPCLYFVRIPGKCSGKIGAQSYSPSKMLQYDAI